MSLEADKQKLRAAAQLAASLIAEVPNVDYVICALRRGTASKDDISILASNLTWQDREDGVTKHPTVGMITDLVLEARLAEGAMSLAQENWRRGTPAERTQ